VTDVLLGLVPCTTITTPGGFDEQRFQKGGLKGTLVVVVEVVEVVTTTATPSTFYLRHLNQGSPSPIF